MLVLLINHGSDINTSINRELTLLWHSCHHFLNDLLSKNDESYL